MSNQLTSSSSIFAPVGHMRRFYCATLVLAAWTLFGLFMAWQAYAMAQRSGGKLTWSYALMSELLYAYAWALLTPLVWYLGRRFYLERSRLAACLLAHALASVAVALSHRAIFAAAMGLYQVHERQQQFLADRFVTVLISYLDYGILLYWMLVILQHAFAYYRHFQEKAVQASQLQTRLAQAQLQALRMQLQPHFLFNTLNAISVLISQDPQGARRMVRDLSEFLRLTLQNQEAQLIPLSAELDFLDRYLQIEHARFGDRLTVRREIAADTLQAQVPHLILQPLVENAVRHGLSGQRGPAFISITARRDNGTLRLEVGDNGKGLARAQAGGEHSGIGLANTRARLQQFYGERHRFELHNAQPRGVVAVLEIPFQIQK